MMIDDPRAHARIDVSSWDLDYLADLLGSMRLDMNVGSERELSEPEIDALTESGNPVGLIALPTARDLHLGNPIVTQAVERLSEIVEVALDQRDLPRAIAKLAGTEPGELTAGERIAYHNFVDAIGLDDFSLLAHGTVSDTD